VPTNGKVGLLENVVIQIGSPATDLSPGKRVETGLPKPRFAFTIAGVVRSVESVDATDNVYGFMPLRLFYLRGVGHIDF